MFLDERRSGLNRMNTYEVISFPVFIKKGGRMRLLAREHRQLIGFETCVAHKL